jgi:hypothetical protein
LPLKLLTFGRAAVAITSVFTPRLFARRFRIQTAGTPAVVLGRMFGIRNAALAFGLIELNSLAAPREFLRLGVAIDLADTTALIVAGRRHEISRSTVLLGISTTLMAAAYGAAALAILPRVDAEAAPITRH